MFKELTLKSFSQKVVEIALSIPKGRVTTYGDIARAAGGGSMASQSITAILSKAEEKGVKDIPFHRIVYANGRVWMSPEYRLERQRLYNEEGITINDKGQIVNFQDVVMRLDWTMFD